MTIHKNIFQRYSYVFLLSIFVLASSLTAFGQETQTGTWKAKISKKDSQKIYISFYRKDSNRSKKGKFKDHVNGSSFKIEDLQGLSFSQVNAANSNVSFSLNREAGIIQMDGTFNNGKGNGNWTFTPDANFISTMESYGFDNISDKKLFASALLNVRSQTVSDLRNAGLTVDEYDDLFKATIFKVDGDYAREMSAAGFENLDLEDLVKARIFKIDAKYASEVVAQGFGKQSMEKLVQFKIFKITPEFLNEMKAEGLTNLSSGDLVQLRIFKIDGEFIQKAREKGYSNPSVGELVELKIHGKVK